MIEEDVENALKTLKAGGVILYPTDTIWGIGCDATNETAVQQIYKIKQRSDTKSMLVLLESANELSRYIDKIPDIANDLIELADKPLTIIYPGAKNLAKNLVAVDGTIGIRIVHDEFCEKLISKFRKPIVSTSANISSESSPANFSEISSNIVNAVDYVVKWRQNDNSRHVPSGIIKLGINGEVEVIRK